MLSLQPAGRSWAGKCIRTVLSWGESCEILKNYRQKRKRVYHGCFYCNCLITGRENLNFKNDWQKKTKRIEY
jgi:hypothetical protein